MLINPTTPIKKRKKKMAVKKRRTAKQKAATRKLVAFNKRRAAPKRKAPARRKAVAKRATTTTRKRRSPARRTTVSKPRTYKRNPSMPKISLKNVVKNQLKPAVVQASGALVLDLGYGYLGGYIPDMLNTGMAKHATKGVIAIALGMVAGNFIKNDTANKLALGAMTVTMHDAVKEAMQTYMPSVPMGCSNTGDLGYYSPSPVVSMDAYVNDTSDGMGAFVNDTGSEFGQQSYDTSNI